VDLLEHGLPSMLALCVYSLVDKVIVPLLKKQSSNGSSEFSNKDLDRRINRNFEDIHEVRSAVADTRESLAAAKAILQRIDQRM